MINWKNNKRILKGIALLLTILIVGFLIPRYVNRKSETKKAIFPFEGARIVYRVKGTSPVGPIFGSLIYTVDEVTGVSYKVTRKTTGNLHKIPSFEKQKTKELGKDEPISFTAIINKSSPVEEKVLEIKGREIEINKYYFESEKKFGKESISIFMAEKIGVPLIYDYKYGKKYQLHIELDKTNIKYLQ